MLVHDYSYDADDHMVQSVRTPPGGVIAYSLDGVGNRTAVVGGSLPGAYSMQSTLREPADFQMNQYTVTPRGVHSYDRQGNLKSVGSGSGPRLTYDYRNRLVAYRAGVSGGQPNSDKGFFAYHYKYDAIGRRTAKVLPAMAVPGQAITSLYYYYDWQLIEERSSVGVNVSYVHGNYIDEVLTMRTSDVDYYYHSDDNHNVMAMSDASGLVVERYEYGDYGAPKFYNAVGAALDTSGIGNRHLFTGREYDGESGLYFYRTRYFDPLDGRFIGRDMIGIWGDRINVGNGYAYIANNPWSGVDPLGLSHNLWHKITEKIEDVIEDVIDELEETAEEIEDAAEEVGEAIVKGVIWISLLPHLVLEATLDLATLPSRLVAWTINSALAGDPTPTRYGQWCGKGSLGGAAIDELDSCCEAHDDCAHSWDAAVSLSWKARACNLALCNCAAKAVCKTDECRAFKNSVLIVFCRDHFGIDCIGNWLP
jgi:RHS repeat-associated protein